MKKFWSILAFFVVTNCYGENIEAIPSSVVCILNGTGSGTCDIVFPSGTTSTCAKPDRVAFDPNAVLGKEVYSMALAAVTAKNPIYIGLLPCNSLGKPEIDTIHFKGQ